MSVAFQSTQKKVGGVFPSPIKKQLQYVNNQSQRTLLSGVYPALQHCDSTILENDNTAVTFFYYNFQLHNI